MSQDMESHSSQGSLAPPVEISGPTVSIQHESLSVSPEPSVIPDSHTSRSDNQKFLSPPPLSSPDLTPPPSSQVRETRPRRSRSQSGPYLEPQPDMEKTLCAAYGASENLPTIEEIDNADESRLRSIAKDLLSATQEARMSALHFKLQNSLLSFASNEAVKRAEVEHQLARREVEILQSSEYRSRHRSPESKPVQPDLNGELEAAVKRNQELERANATLDRRLRRAKKLIEEERESSDLLREEIGLLKKRIRDNREHLSQMLEHSLLSPSSQTDSQTPKRSSVPQYADNASIHIRRGESHDPFAALLAADKVLNRESASVSSTPNQHHIEKQRESGHVRGSHSFSSLPITPVRSRTERQYLTPVRNPHDESCFSFPDSQERDRRDSDSTISASDVEEAVTDRDLPASQASTLATSVLRRNNVIGRKEAHTGSNIPRSSALLQTKLFGQVRKAGVEPPTNPKRKASFEDNNPVSVKKSKAGSVGLGLDTWNVSRA